MNVALAYTPEDEKQAHSWFKWCEELGGCEIHSLFVLPFKGLTAPEIRGWKEVKILTDFTGMKSDWTGGDLVRDASGPNYSFREFARYFHALNAGPWLRMEPDAIPLRRQWLNAIENEYRVCGRRIMASAVDREDTPRHPSGIAIYPWDLAITAQNYMRPRMMYHEGKYYEGAFNLAGAADAFANFHDASLIQQVFRHPGFATRQQMESVLDPNAVVFHSDKRHSLIRLLRPGAVESEPAKSGSGGVLSHPPSFTPPRHPEQAEPAPKTWTDRVRVLVGQLEKMVETPSHRRMLHLELRRAGLIKEAKTRK